jgi:ubiquinone biosynthesis protein
VPVLYEPYSTGALMTMEFIDGIKPDDLPALRGAGLDPKLIADRGARFILKQVFDFGFFHTDPHPGNLLVLPDNVLAPLDFGQAARLNEDDRQLVADLILAIADRDTERLLRAFQRAGMLDNLDSPRDLTRGLDDLLDRYSNQPIKDIPLGTVIMQTFDLMRQHRIHPPAEFTLMLKCLMTTESLAVALNPDFQLISHIRPYARRLAMERLDPRKLLRQGRRSLRDVVDLIQALPSDITAILAKAKRGEIQMRVQHEHLESLVHTLDRSSSRVSFALVIAGTIIASSLLVTQPEGTVLGLVTFQTFGILGYLAAAMMGVWLVISIIRSRHL